MNFPRINFVVFAALSLQLCHQDAVAQFSWDGDCGINWYDCCGQGKSFVNNWTIPPNPSACPALPGPTDTVSLSDVVDSDVYIISVAGLSQSGTFLCHAQFLNILDGDITTSGSPTEPGMFQLFGGSIINLYDGATFNIGSFSTLDVRNGVVHPGGGPGQVLVVSGLGTLTKTAEPGSNSMIDVPIDNQGLISVPVGTLRLLGGGISTGVIEALGGTVYIQGTLTLDGEVRGAGTIQFAGGTSNVIGDYHPTNTLINGANGTVNFQVNTSIDNLTLDNASVLGGKAQLTVDDLTCYGAPATINPGGTLIVQGTALFKGLYNNGAIDLQRDMELHGASTIELNTDLRLTQSEVRNHGVLQLMDNANVKQSCCTVDSGLKNFGTLQKTGGGSSLINVIVSNAGGTIDVQSGTLVLQGDMASTGPITVNAGATLRLDLGQQSLFSEGSITGPGEVKFAPVYFQPVIDVLGGTYDVATTTIDYGTVQFQHEGVTNTLNMNGGVLDGDADFVVNQQLNWSGGEMGGAGVTKVFGPMQMISITQGFLERTLDIDQSAALAGACTPNATGTMQIGSLGVLRGRGSVDGNVNNNFGQVSPGSPGLPVGDLCITGNYSQSYLAELRIDLANQSSFDHVNVGGTAGLAGKLTVTGGYTTNQTFTILTASNVTGTFAQVIAPAGMMVTYTPTAVILQGAPGPTCPADIAPQPNGNSIVNVDDLLAVINSWGSCSGCAADLVPSGPPQGNGVVNVDDLLFVINNWGPC